MNQIDRETSSRLAFAGFALFTVLMHPADAAPPELPRTTVDTSMPAMTGSSIIVNSGDDLQAAINLAEPGDEIVLEAGATFTGPFTLPDKGQSTDWIVIRGSANEALPPAGTRISPEDATNMPKIVGSGSPVIAFKAAPNAHHYRIIGLEIYPREGQRTYSLNTFDWSNHHITFDRVYGHGNDLGGRRFVAFHGRNMAIVDSHISDWWENGADSQAVWWTEGQTHLLHNNFLEGAGEVVMTGGSSYTDARLASDITITNNTFTKRLSWWPTDPSYDGKQRTIKNLLEFKVARRALVDANTFTNFWIQHQRLPIVFKSTNQAPNCSNPTAQVEHITFSNNLLNGIGSGIQVANEGICSNGELNSQYILIENNLLLDMNLSREWSHVGRGFEILGTHPDIIIRHNTLFTPEGEFNSAFLWIEGNLTGLIFENNIVGHSQYGLLGSGMGIGVDTLDTVAPGAVYEGNVQYGVSTFNDSSRYPNGQYFPRNIAEIDFVNYIETGGGEYRLSETSPFKNAGSDGMDPGIDWDVFEAAQIDDRKRPAPISDLR